MKITELAPGTIGRLEAIIHIRESVLEKFEAEQERLPVGHWKIPMYESLIDSYTESMIAIDEILQALGWDWEQRPDGFIRLIKRDEDTDEDTDLEPYEET